MAALKEMHFNSERVQSTLESLRCPVCYKVMDAKIFLCVNGHNLCSDCKEQVNECPTCRAAFTGARNHLVEDLVKSFEYPCENVDVGCQEMLALCKAEKHKEECLYRKYRCYSRDFEQCDWTGRYPDIEQHILHKHASALTNLKEIFFCDKNFSNISSGHSDYMFIKKNDEMFVFYYDREPIAGNMYFVGQYIGPTDIAAQYQYKVTFFNEDRSKEMALKCDVHTDCKAIKDLHKSEKCIAIQYKMVVQFVRYDDTLQFFVSIIKKR